jgi:deoxycytidine triphosphate deaminase
MNGVLPHQEILGLIPNVIVNGVEASVGTASYDMQLGDEYYLYDEKPPDGQSMRSRGKGGIVIPPNGLLMCTMHETLKLPPDIVGHLSLKVPLLMKGIMMASQSQIDAGYEGRIFGMLYNLSQRDVCLRDRSPVLKLELIRLEQATSKPYNNSISKTATLQTYIDRPLISSLVEIRENAKSAVKEVQEAKKTLNLTQVGAAIGASIITLAITFITAYSGWHFASDSKLDQLSQKVDSLGIPSKVSEAIDPLKSRLDELERQNKLLQARLDAAGFDQSQPQSNAERVRTNPNQATGQSGHPGLPHKRLKKPTLQSTLMLQLSVQARPG